MTMSQNTTQTRVAVLQAESCWFDLDASVQKTITYIEEASQKGAQLIAFPEVWIPGYPAWIWARPIDNDLTTKYAQNSLSVNSPQMNAICTAAAKNKINVCLGYSERDGNSLYISQSIISSDGEIKMTRRKIKPTHMERTIFGEGSGSALQNVVETNVGRVGALACWEHTQPLLKYHTASQNEQIHVAAWPPLGDCLSQGLYSASKQGAQTLVSSYAIETQSFVLHSTGVFSQGAIELMGTQGNSFFGYTGGGGAVVFGPDGRKISEDLPETEEGLVIADIDLEVIISVKGFLDVVGHYSRPDLLRLVVDKREKGFVEANLGE